jgi:hypothetical protein
MREKGLTTHACFNFTRQFDLQSVDLPLQTLVRVAHVLQLHAIYLPLGLGKHVLVTLPLQLQLQRPDLVISLPLAAPLTLNLRLGCSQLILKLALPSANIFFHLQDLCLESLFVLEHRGETRDLVLQVGQVC